MSKLNTLLVVSAAIAAYRGNNGQVINKIKENDTRITNRTLVDAALAGRIEVLEITDEDRANAQTLVDEMQQRNTLALLTGKKVSSFMTSFLEAIKDETTNTRNIGVIVWGPKLHEDSKKSDDTQNELALLSYGSKYIGKIGDKIELDFVTIVERYTTEYNCWRYTGHDTNGNLVGFLSKNKLTSATIRIKGRVKSQSTSRFAKGNTTYLNYVKEIK